MKRQLHLSEPASEDIDRIWLFTAETYDVAHAEAYLSLLQQAFDDIEEDPERPTSRLHPELGKQIRSYHIALSKRRSGTGIKAPRHVVVYTLEYQNEILVLRILHDRMEAHRHLPRD